MRKAITTKNDNRQIIMIIHRYGIKKYLKSTNVEEMELVCEMLFP